MPESFLNFAAALSLIVQVACSSGSGAERTVPASFEGYWRGRMLSSNELTRKIDLFVFQREGSLEGSYRCAFGTTTCLNGNFRGRISGKSGAQSFQITLDDASVCRFSGQFSTKHAGGQYSCYSGGSLIDHGSWEIVPGDPN